MRGFFRTFWLLLPWGLFLLALLLIHVGDMQVDSALNMAGDFQEQLYICQVDRLQEQTALQACNTKYQSLEADLSDFYNGELRVMRPCR